MAPCNQEALNSISTTPVIEKKYFVIVFSELTDAKGHPKYWNHI